MFRYSLAYPDSHLLKPEIDILLFLFSISPFVILFCLLNLILGYFILIYWRIKHRKDISKKAKRILNVNIFLSSFLFLFELPFIIYFIFLLYSPSFYIEDIFIGGELLHCKGGEPILLQNLEWFYSRYSLHILHLISYSSIQLIFLNLFKKNQKAAPFIP